MTIACVEHGDYQKHGRRYVSTLRSMVRRNTQQAHRFVCLTDEPGRHPGVECQLLPSREKDGLSGWWAKIFCFTPDRFEGRVVFLDLDVVITGSLDELAAHKGITHLGQWGWAKNDYGSAVMVWDGGEHSEIWSQYNSNVPHRFKGDQDWLTHLGGWDALPEGMTRSYRYHCKDGPPAGCAVCAMHGPDKPHLIESGWVPQAWH